MRWVVDYGVKVYEEPTLGQWRVSRNPDREWWQFWKPRWMRSATYGCCTITELL